MKPFRPAPLSRWIARVSPALVVVGIGEPANAATSLVATGTAVSRHPAGGDFGFAYDGVLGTSLDARLRTPRARDAREGERRILAEIDRLEKILSPRDPASEFNRVRAGGDLSSPELADVFAAYDTWSARTQGALHVNLAGVAALWRDATRLGVEPDPATLAAAFARPRAFAIDALGKAYVVDRAVAVAREFASSGWLNLGGDLRAWGEQSWMVDVANPFDAAENAPPLAQIPLRNAAIATSGGYARNFTVGARRYSHLIDPRTLRPLAIDRAASVVATDCVSANALATALCVLDATAAQPLAAALALDHLRVGAADDVGASRGFGTLRPAAPAKSLSEAAAVAASPSGSWPANYQLSVDISLKTPDGFRAKRPYVAVWVEDADHRVIRTITVWGTGKYQPDLTKWWRAIGGSRQTASAVSRATRYPGAYTVTWDGRDQRGQPVPQGDYTLCVEINREHGHHVSESTTITCGGEATTAELRDTAESETGAIAYGPRGG